MEAAFGILGPTALRLDGVLEARWSYPKPRALLTTMLLHPNRKVPVATLLDWIWGDDDRPRKPDGALHKYATQIRTRLERLPIHAHLQAKSGAYLLDTTRGAIDYFQFRDLSTAAQRSRESDPAEAIRLAEAALALVRGRPLEDLHSRKADAWRTAFERNELTPTHAARLGALVELGRAGETLPLLDDLQSDSPDNLTFHKLRLTALQALNRNEEAAEYYLDLHRALRQAGEHQAADHLRQHQNSLIAKESGTAAVAYGATGFPIRQLRHGIRDFIGRAQELAALDAAAFDHDGNPIPGVVVLEGMGGVGKTTLAVHWGRRWRARFPDGDLFVDLNGFAADSEPALTHASVVDELLAGLGEEPVLSATPRSREVALRRTLANRRTLVVLDNARNSEHVQRLLPLLADGLVVVTSRQTLTTLCASYGAKRITINPMSTAECSRLLAVHLGSETRMYGDLCEELVRFCGGLPLVLTVAAHHIADYRHLRSSTQRDPARILLELGLTADGDLSPQTAFSATCRRLPQGPQRLFRLLGLHPGREFAIAAAASCSGRPEVETRDHLSALVGAHLLERTEAPDRYRLHDLLKECAHTLAHTDESPPDRRAAERRVLSFYLTSATAAHETLYPDHATGPPLDPAPQISPVGFTEPHTARAWFRDEHTNLTSAIALAVKTANHDYAWRLPHAVRTYLERHGYSEDARAALETAVAAARAGGDHEAEASSANDLGLTYMARGQFTDARHCLHRALEYADRAEDHRARGVIHFQLGRLALLLGSPAEAVPLLRRSLDLARASGNTEAKRWTHQQLGVALCATGRLDEALLHLREAQHHALEARDESAQARVLAGIGAVWAVRGEHNDAVAYTTTALRTAESAHDAPAIVEIRLALSEVERARGAARHAEQHARQAIALAGQIRHAPLLARCLEALGDAVADLDRPNEARTAWSEASALYKSMSDPARRQAVNTKLSTLPSELNTTTRGTPIEWPERTQPLK
ncbi:tetratricopeptide repeat protein [Actinokineospora auranticolor]|uniref:DNA-binding SARP family transcriptional activator n=1 Tax=Actinokineospora auranticolor TaxID=155976 RepID=A0A2S6GCH7_9PSEU|nr:tetratricopeptide repeat protein [Actinokineospora auranticolor]PPK62553.1 DNA-binding SARP family transcriptional activator [Actinokineospora auranticolor]